MLRWLGFLKVRCESIIRTAIMVALRTGGSWGTIKRVYTETPIRESLRPQNLGSSFKSMKAIVPT